jgi:hypothetical protein
MLIRGSWGRQGMAGAMREQMEAVERNNTWELVDMPQGHRPIEQENYPICHRDYYKLDIQSTNSALYQMDKICATPIN